MRSLSQQSRSIPENATPPSPPVTPSPTISSHQFDNFTIGAIRRRVHDMFSAKQNITVRALVEDLRKAQIIPEDTSRMSVWRILHKMGFRYKTSQRKMYVRKEFLDIYAGV